MSDPIDFEPEAPETAPDEDAPKTILPPLRRPTGHIPDTPEQKARHKTTKHLLGAPGRLPLVASLLSATPGFKSQRRSSSCVGFDIWRCVDTRLEVMGVPHEEHSARGVYTFAREWARSSAQSEGITDTGSSPSDAFAALAEWGVPLERDFPSDADALDNHIDEEADVETLKDAAAFKVTGVYAIDDLDGAQCERDVMQAVSSGYPVSFAIAVGDLFQNYDGKGDVAPEPDASVPCNHAVAILAYETDEATGEVVFTAFSPWENWGKGGGLFTFRRALLADRRTTDFYVVTLGPKDPPAKPEEPKAVAP